MNPGGETWDLFCRVVDNYGDVGIGWRLAKQLAVDQRRSVRLIVDGRASLALIEPRLVSDEGDAIDGVVVETWAAFERRSPCVPAEVVIELLGCGLPPACLAAMATAATPPVWIDFEHLSAEPWVTGFHGLPSPHPTLPLVKHFFYPGFVPGTGGLLIEPGLDRKRAVFVEAAGDIDALWRRFGVSAPMAGETRIALFAYPDAPVASLLRVLADDPVRHWSIVVPKDVATVALDNWFDRTGHVRRYGRLTVFTIPFTSQPDYDRLLWACDIVFVRGEDSFIRAQVAGRPFVWQIYRQADAVHLQKLAAFEALYEAAMPAKAAVAQQAFWRGWNNGAALTDDAIRDWIAALPALASHADAWRAKLAAEEPLIDRLVDFVAARREAPGQPPVC
ncbi:MAG: elongation factor P maturation arginine rhamnosyltransferase EarP [Burkholderiaceae bacterium]